jgi:hypothetical protein
MQSKGAHEGIVSKSEERDAGRWREREWPGRSLQDGERVAEFVDLRRGLAQGGDAEQDQAEGAAEEGQGQAAGVEQAGQGQPQTDGDEAVGDGQKQQRQEDDTANEGLSLRRVGGVGGKDGAEGGGEPGRGEREEGQCDQQAGGGR